MIALQMPCTAAEPSGSAHVYGMRSRVRECFAFWKQITHGSEEIGLHLLGPNTICWTRPMKKMPSSITTADVRKFRATAL